MCDSRAGAHSGGAWRFRIASQLVALSRTIDHLARVGSADGLASLCGMILVRCACIYAYHRVDPYGMVSFGGFSEFFRLTT